MWLSEFSRRINDVYNREVSALHEHASRLTVKWVRNVHFLGHLKAALAQRLYDTPGFVKGLHETGVVRDGTNDEILLLVSPD
jgi:hypothetical protein